mgnify:CR=1 FL=1
MRVGAGQVSVSCKLTPGLFLLKYLLHFTFRLEGNVNNLDVMNGLYLLLSTNNFILCTTRKSDEAGPSPHNILTRVCVRVICGFPKKVIENCLDLIITLT